MGYTTIFEGRVDFNKPLTESLDEWLRYFAATRHYQKKVDVLKEQFPNDELKTNLPPVADYRETMNFGEDAKFLGGKDGSPAPFVEMGSPWCKDYNRPAGDCPGLWLQWVPTEDLMGLEWNGGEKFYNYVEWLEWLIKYIFSPDRYILNGKIKFQGEDFDDRGYILINNNVVTVHNYIDASELTAKELISLIAGESVSIDNDMINDVKNYITNVVNKRRSENDN